MKTYNFALYGLANGALYAIYGSLFFSFFVVMLFFLEGDGETFAMGVFGSVLFSSIFSILPGAFGGACLARWLQEGERTIIEIKQRGRLIGLLAGLLAVLFSSVISVPLVMGFMGGYIMVIVFGVVALLIAGGMGESCAKRLVKKLERIKTLQSSNPLP